MRHALKGAALNVHVANNSFVAVPRVERLECA
jgi:hypothetical protein